MTKIVPFEDKPWGRYDVLSSFKEMLDVEASCDVVIKKITVNPLKRLSLQSHDCRKEVWFVISGEGEATLGNKKIKVSAGSNLNVQVKEKHRIANTNPSVPLIFIEISTGNFDEDDITRYEDDFGRAK